MPTALIALLSVLIVIGILILSSVVFLIRKNHKNTEVLKNLSPENYQELSRLSQNLEKLPILDTKVENLSQTLHSQTSFLPKMETKIDSLEQKVGTEASLNLLKENLANLQKLTNELDKKAKTIEVKTDNHATTEQQKLREVTNHLGQITNLDESIATNLKVSMGQTKMIPTIDTKVESIKQHTNEINAIKENLNNLNKLVNLVNEATIQIANSNKENHNQNLSHLTAVQKNISDLNRIFINDRNRGYSGEKILEDFLGNYFGAKGPTRLWETQYKVTNINKPNQHIGLVDAVIFTPYEDQKIAIDAKFPTLDYKKIFDEQGNANPVYKREFENNIKNKVKDLKKYIHPDNKIASVIMFLPSENIYYFIVNKCPELMDYAYSENIWLAGPTTLMAILSSQNQVIRENHFAKNIYKMKDLIISLQSEFDRLDKRTSALKNIYDKYVKSSDMAFKELRTTQDKINSKVERLESLEEDKITQERFLEVGVQPQLVSEAGV